MRKILWVFLIAILMVIHCAKTERAVVQDESETGRGVVFQELTFDEAIDLAQQEGKPVMIDLFLPG